MAFNKPKDASVLSQQYPYSSIRSSNGPNKHPQSSPNQRNAFRNPNASPLINNNTTSNTTTTTNTNTASTPTFRNASSPATSPTLSQHQGPYNNGFNSVSASSTHERVRNLILIY